MFSEHCDPQFQVEAVEVTQVDGSKEIYPKLAERGDVINVQEVNSKIGIDIDDAKMAHLLNRMGLSAKVESKNTISLVIPPTRYDIISLCDIVEDVAISYGYNNIKKTIPKCNCISSEFELNRLTDFLRLELAQCGYTEALTFTLVIIYIELLIKSKFMHILQHIFYLSVQERMSVIN